MNLNEIAKEAWESAEDNGWHAAKEDENGDLRFTSTFERLGLIHSEVSEAYEAFRKFGSMKVAWGWRQARGSGIGVGRYHYSCLRTGILLGSIRPR